MPGLNDPTTFLRYIPKSRLDARVASWIDQHGGVEKILEEEGGFDLWGTPDGLHWTCITRTGFGNPFNNGVRTLKSTPRGLFVGSMHSYRGERSRDGGIAWRHGDLVRAP